MPANLTPHICGKSYIDPPDDGCPECIIELNKFKTEVHTNYYTKDEVYNKGETYNKDESDELFEGKLYLQPSPTTVTDSTQVSYIEEGKNTPIKMEDIKKYILEGSYPVGTYYWTSQASFNPNTAWGGTWVKIDEGIVLTSAGTNYPVASNIGQTTKDGGATTSSTGNTTLSTDTIPAHTHGKKDLTGYLEMRPGVFYAATGIASGSYITATQQHVGLHTSQPNVVRVSYDVSHEHDSVGGGGAHNHGSVSTMQPYKNAYLWHRIA